MIWWNWEETTNSPFSHQPTVPSQPFLGHHFWFHNLFILCFFLKGPRVLWYKYLIMTTRFIASINRHLIAYWIIDNASHIDTFQIQLPQHLNIILFYSIHYPWLLLLQWQYSITPEKVMIAYTCRRSTACNVMSIQKDWSHDFTHT